MERSREARKAPMTAPVGVSRRRHRGSSQRESPDVDGPVELQETVRMRDRKKERERERERDRGRSSRNKRRRGDRLIHAGNIEDGHADSTDESVNDEDEEDYEDDGGIGGGNLKMPPPNPASNSSPSLLNHHQNHHRKSFPQQNNSTKMFRPASPWKPADEMIGVPVPRKARSASTKRAHDCWVSGSSGLIGGDQLHRQASTSPARSSLVSATASPLRMSPPSSNLSSQKKMKVIGSNKHRNTPKTSISKTASSNQEEIEFEIAEVLYGMMTQPPDATKTEGDFNEASNISASDSKSRVSSPVSAAAPGPQQSSTGLPGNSGSSALVVTVPKRKRPRPVNYGDENNGYPSRDNIIPKSVVDPVVKAEQRSIVSEKNFKPVLASDRNSPDLEQSRDESTAKASAILTLPIRNASSESENLRVEPTVAGLKDVDAISTKRDSPVNRFDENGEANSRPIATVSGIKREEKFQIDLMAPPPSSRLSPDRDGNVQYISSEPNKSIPNLQDLKHVVNKEAAADGSRNLADSDHTRFRRGPEAQKASFIKERDLNLQLNAGEKTDLESGMTIAGAGNQEILNQHQQGQPQLPRISTGDEATKAISVPAASSLPSAMSVAGWPGGLPPYMAPLQGVVPMEGNALSSTPLQAPHVLLNQPRPKRCATHCYIARSISCHQQFTRMNPFWPAAAGSAATLYGANPCNLNIVPPAELHCNTGVRGVNPVPDKSLGVFPGSNTGKDQPSHAPNIADTQRKQILLQQSVPSGVPGNLLRGPAFIFPMSQQQAAAAATSLTTTMKNPSGSGASLPVNPNSGPGSAPTSVPATMNFNYPNMATNETQYLAILQNNPYQFPFPTHAGAPQVYRGTHPQAMPFFNGTFYSPQILHPSQLQQQPQQPAHGHQVPSGQNIGISSGSSSSQKHLQIHSQKSQGNGSGVGSTGNMKQSYPSPKGRPSHLPLKQHNQHLTDAGGEDSPSTADSRGSRSNFGMYTEGLTMPINAQNFALMSASSVSAGVATATANGVATGNHYKNGNHIEKKPHQHQQGLKVGSDSLPSHQGYAVSFASINGDGGPPALDIKSIGQNHAILQNFPDAARHHSYQVMVAQQQAQQSKKNSRIAEEVKKASNVEASNIEDERQSMVGKGVLSNVGLSIAFSRSDTAESSPGNSVVDSSSRNVKVGSGPGRAPGPLLSNSMTNTQQQLLPHHHQQLQQQKAQLIQLHKQPQQYMASAPRGKTQSLSNGNVYSDQLPTNAAMTAKLTNSVSTFQQSHAPISGGGGNSPTQSQQWKHSARASASQVPSPVSVPTNSASTKNHYPQQSHMQISFGGSNPKPLSAAQGQQHPSLGHQNPAQMMVGSAAASINHRSSGSPRTTATAGMVGMVSSKAPQTTTLSPSASLQVKHVAMPSRSSSPVGARNVPSALGNSNMGMPQGNSGSKTQMFQQQHQQQQMKQQLSKQGMQHGQFPSYLQTSQGLNQTSFATSVTAAPPSGYLQRRRPEVQQSQQQSQSPSGSSSTGMLSMCSSSVAVTTDPAKAIADAAAAGNNMKAPSK